MPHVHRKLQTKRPSPLPIKTRLIKINDGCNRDKRGRRARGHRGARRDRGRTRLHEVVRVAFPQADADEATKRKSGRERRRAHLAGGRHVVGGRNARILLDGDEEHLAPGRRVAIRLARGHGGGPVVATGAQVGHGDADARREAPVAAAGKVAEYLRVLPDGAGGGGWGGR